MPIHRKKVLHTSKFPNFSRNLRKNYIQKNVGSCGKLLGTVPGYSEEVKGKVWGNLRKSLRKVAKLGLIFGSSLIETLQIKITKILGFGLMVSGKLRDLGKLQVTGSRKNAGKVVVTLW